MLCMGPWPWWASWALGTCCCCLATVWASMLSHSLASPGSVLASAWPALPLSSWTPSFPGRCVLGQGRAGVEGAGTRPQTSYSIQNLGLQSLPKHVFHFPTCLQPFDYTACLAHEAVTSTSAYMSGSTPALNWRWAASADLHRQRERAGPGWAPAGSGMGFLETRGILVSRRPVLSHPERVCNKDF